MTGPRTQPPHIDGFRVVDWLGGGGFADVFRYEETSLSRLVAVKVLHGGLGSAALDAFRNEASVMAKLSYHASIVTIYRTAVSKDRRPFLVMELCPSRHLGARIARSTYPVAKALEITIQIAGAVETAHRLGVLHRDIKPANILFGQSGRPLLSDFGISVAVSGGATSAGTALSPLWAPPEQFGNSPDPVGPYSDVYSLAATLWAMLAGRSPMDIPGSNDRLALADRVRRQPILRVSRDDVPESLQRVLAAAMAKHPAERYASMLEFARDLQAVQAELHLPRTDVELLDEHLDESVYVEAGSGTVISNFVLIQPDQPTSGSGTQTSAFVDLGSTQTSTGGQAGHVIRHGTGYADPIEPLDFTGPVVPSVEDHSDRPSDQAGQNEPVRGIRRTVGVVIALAVLVCIIGAALALVLGRMGPGTTSAEPTTVTADPQDPVGVAAPKVTDLKVVNKGGKVTATWANPAPLAGDTYLYEVKDPSRPSELEVVERMRISVDPLPGQTCIAISLRRANGTVSEPAVECARS